MAPSSTARFRMPLVFGPTPGPRQGPNLETFSYLDAPRRNASVSFLTDAAVLQRFLPPRCELYGSPVVTVEHMELLELEWLAGRGYSLIGVRFPVRYTGPVETVSGPFLSVLWENRPEPILSGREELGYAKLYCELPPPRALRGARHYEASWDGHAFIRMTLADLEPAAPGASPQVDGILHHRYFPAVSPSGGEVDEMVLTPSGNAPLRYELFQQGRGTVEFVKSTWEQLPTMFHIVNALAELPIIEYRGAVLSHTRGGKDLSDQYVLR